MSEEDQLEITTNTGETRSPFDIYQNRTGRFGDKASELKKKYERWSWYRLLVIILGAVAVYLMFGIYPIAGVIGLIALVAGFLTIVLRHLAIQKEQIYYERLRKLNETEKQYLEGNYVLPDSGVDWLTENHAYAVDLDIFGKNSIYHFLNRTRTQGGRKILAEALSAPREIEKILDVQEAIQELSPQLDWRQQFLASVEDQITDQKDFANLISWLDTPNQYLNWSLLSLIRFGVPIITIIATYLVIMYMPLGTLLFVLLLPGIILSRHATKISTIQEQTEESVESLKNYAALISHVESGSFQSSLLSNLQARMHAQTGAQASVRIQKLSFYINQLNVRRNPFAVILNLYGMWDFHWVCALEKWKKENKDLVGEWFEALGEIDNLISWSNLHYNNPDWQFPRIGENFKLSATALGHPLIISKNRVTNDLQMDLKGNVRLITGSNMAGKSTFLRTVGTNLVLAYAGAPVCAKHLEAPILHIYTSMRTKDNLHENTSSFYAELKRLKLILEAVETTSDAFFLLDEILKGTNSVDRNTGARAFILQLMKNQGAGLIATHDLDLAKLEKETKGALENWCFEVDIIEDRLDFDYKIKQGVCQSFNATYLMKNMGFDL